MDAFVALAAVGRFKNHPGWLEWTTDSFTVEAAGGIIQVGVDGEALEVPSPMVCRIVPGGLRLMLPEGITPGAARTPGMFDRTTLMRLWNVATKGSAG
jgi:diacylglycerol kinase family enzyme